MEREQLIRAINAAAADGNEAVVRELGAEMQRRFPSGASVMDEPVSRSQAARVGATQGVTYGFGDELIGAFGGDTEAERDLLRRAREQRPGITYGAEVGAGVGTGIGTARALFAGMRGLRAMSPFAQRATYPAIGAAEGALYGAGASLEGERGGGAATGAALGAGAAVALPAAVAAGGWTLDRAMRALRSPDRASREAVQEAISRVAREEGVSPGDVLDFLREDPRHTLADFSDRFRGRAAASMRGARRDAREEVQAYHRSRIGHNAQSGRLDDAIEGITQTRGQSYRQQVDRLSAERRAMADAEYGPLLREAEGIYLPDNIRALMRTPVIENAFDGAATLARMTQNLNEGEVLGNAARLHWAKHRLGDMASEASRAGRGTEAKALMDAKRTVEAFLNDAVPGYADLTARYGDTFSHQRAAEAGRRLFRGSLDFEDVEQLGRLTGTDAEMFAIGVKDAVRQRIFDRGGTDPGRLFSPPQWARLRQVLGDHDATELARHLSEESRIWRTSNALDSVSAQLGLDAPSVGVDAASAAALGKPGFFLIRTLSALSRKAEHLNPAEHDAILRATATPLRRVNGQVDEAAVRELERILTPIYNRHFGTAGAAGVLGGGHMGRIEDPTGGDRLGAGEGVYNGVLEE